jgi:hypothetical protein
MSTDSFILSCLPEEPRRVIFREYLRKVGPEKVKKAREVFFVQDLEVKIYN